MKDRKNGWRKRIGGSCQGWKEEVKMGRTEEDWEEVSEGGKDKGMERDE